MFSFQQNSCHSVLGLKQQQQQQQKQQQQQQQQPHESIHSQQIQRGFEQNNQSRDRFDDSVKYEVPQSLSSVPIMNLSKISTMKPAGVSESVQLSKFNLSTQVWEDEMLISQCGGLNTTKNAGSIFNNNLQSTFRLSLDASDSVIITSSIDKSISYRPTTMNQPQLQALALHHHGRENSDADSQACQNPLDSCKQYTSSEQFANLKQHQLQQQQYKQNPYSIQNNQENSSSIDLSNHGYAAQMQSRKWYKADVTNHNPKKILAPIDETTLLFDEENEGCSRDPEQDSYSVVGDISSIHYEPASLLSTIPKHQAIQTRQEGLSPQQFNPNSFNSKLSLHHQQQSFYQQPNRSGNIQKEELISHQNSQLEQPKINLKNCYELDEELLTLQNRLQRIGHGGSEESVNELFHSKNSSNQQQESNNYAFHGETAIREQQQLKKRQHTMQNRLQEDILHSLENHKSNKQNHGKYQKGNQMIQVKPQIARIDSIDKITSNTSEMIIRQLEKENADLREVIRELQQRDAQLENHEQLIRQIQLQNKVALQERDVQIQRLSEQVKLLMVSQPTRDCDNNNRTTLSSTPSISSRNQYGQLQTQSKSTFAGTSSSRSLNNNSIESQANGGVATAAINLNSQNGFQSILSDRITDRGIVPSSFGYLNQSRNNDCEFDTAATTATFVSQRTSRFPLSPSSLCSLNTIGNTDIQKWNCPNQMPPSSSLSKGNKVSKNNQSKKHKEEEFLIQQERINALKPPIAQKRSKSKLLEQQQAQGSSLKKSTSRKVEQVKQVVRSNSSHENKYEQQFHDRNSKQKLRLRSTSGTFRQHQQLL